MNLQETLKAYVEDCRSGTPIAESPFYARLKEFAALDGAVADGAFHTWLAGKGAAYLLSDFQSAEKVEQLFRDVEARLKEPVAVKPNPLMFAGVTSIYLGSMAAVALGIWALGARRKHPDMNGEAEGSWQSRVVHGTRPGIASSR